MSAPAANPAEVPTRLRPVDDDTVVDVATHQPDPDALYGVLLRLTNDAVSATPGGPPLDVSGLLTPAEAYRLASALTRWASQAATANARLLTDGDLL